MSIDVVLSRLDRRSAAAVCRVCKENSIQTEDELLYQAVYGYLQSALPQQIIRRIMRVCPPGYVWLFSYGSNNPEQLARRLRLTPSRLRRESAPAVLAGYMRAFSGVSGVWGSKSVATVVPNPDHLVYGYIVRIPMFALQHLDTLEGPTYDRLSVVVHVRIRPGIFRMFGEADTSGGSKDSPVFMYMRNDNRVFRYPSKRYLDQVYQTQTQYWMLPQVAVCRTDGRQVGVYPRRDAT